MPQGCLFGAVSAVNGVDGLFDLTECGLIRHPVMLGRALVRFSFINEM